MYVITLKYPKISSKTFYAASSDGGESIDYYPFYDIGYQSNTLERAYKIYKLCVSKNTVSDNIISIVHKDGNVDTIVDVVEYETAKTVEILSCM